MMVVDEHNGLETAHSYSTVVHLRGKTGITRDVLAYRPYMYVQYGVTGPDQCYTF